MDESKKVGGGLDFMEVVLGVIGALTVALGVLVIIVGLVNVNISGLILGGIVIGSGLSCLAVAAVLQILKDIRTELKTLNEGVRANST